MKRSYEDFSTEKNVKRARKDELLSKIDNFDDLIVSKNWQSALKNLNEDQQILNLFRGGSVSINPLDLTRTLGFLLENNATLELLNKLWVGNKKLHSALKFLPSLKSELLMTQVLSLTAEYDDFKTQYIANIDNLKLLEYAFEINKQFFDYFITPAILGRMQHLSQLREGITHFVNAIREGQSNEVNSLWEKNQDIRRWFKREKLCIFEDTVEQLTLSDLFLVFKAMFSVSDIEPIINEIATRSVGFKKFLIENIANRPTDKDLVKLFGLMLDYPQEKLVFKCQDLLQNPFLQNAIRNNQYAESIYHYLIKIGGSGQTTLLEQYVKYIDNVQLLKNGITLFGQKNSPIAIATLEVLQARLTNLSQLEIVTFAAHSESSFFHFKPDNSAYDQEFIDLTYTDEDFEELKNIFQ